RAGRTRSGLWRSRGSCWSRSGRSPSACWSSEKRVATAWKPRRSVQQLLQTLGMTPAARTPWRRRGARSGRRSRGRRQRRGAQGRSPCDPRDLEAAMNMQTGPADEVREATSAWWLLVLIGLLAIAAGVIVLLKPEDSLSTLAVIAGIFVLASGIFDI